MAAHAGPAGSGAEAGDDGTDPMAVAAVRRARRVGDLPGTAAGGERHPAAGAGRRGDAAGWHARPPGAGGGPMGPGDHGRRDAAGRLGTVLAGALRRAPAVV